MKFNWMKYTRIALVCLLVIGLLSSSFGIVVAALTNQSLTVKNEQSSDPSRPGEESPETFVSPLEQYGGNRDGEAALNDNVTVISEDDMLVLQKAFVSAESIDNWGEKFTRFHFSAEQLIEPVEETPDTETAPEEAPDAEMTPEEEALLEQAKEQAVLDARALLSETIQRTGQNQMVFLPGDTASLFGGDRIFCVRNYDSGAYSETATLDLYEPYFQDAFKSIDICTTEILTEDKLVNAAFAPGVSAHFGDAAVEVTPTPTSNTGTAQVTPLSSRNTPIQATPLDNKYSTEGGDLVVTLEYELDSEKKNGIESSYKLTGSFGIRDLQAHLVCKVEEPLNFQELYCGLSGQVFADISFSGGVEGEAAPDTSELDLLLLKAEGLNEKRFPIAVFQFQGTTPVYITNKAFEASRESVLPSLYVILFADWEGRISMELTTTLKYAESFNSGLRVFKNGELKLGFEEYPYPTDFEDTPDDGLSWSTEFKVEADTDLTLFGGSVLFYVAGVNLGEICAVKLGAEAKCNLTLTAGINQNLEIQDNAEANAYIRGYLKLLEVKLKLKVEGELIFEGLSKDVDFQFCVLDLTLFVWGKAPDKYKKKYPVSTMERPDEFSSVLCLVCDVSGSMADRIETGQTKLEAAQEAAVTVTSTAQSWGSQFDGYYGVGIVKFSNDGASLVLPHVDYPYIRDSIALMEAGGGTNICSGIDTGIAQLESVVATNKVMIVMTDGQDSAGNATLTSAQAAADKGIVIYTIGFGKDVNEELLQEIAQIGGGEYRFANTDSIMGIVGGFLYAQQSADADVLAEMESTVGEGELSEQSNFTVKGQNGDLIITTVWPGSFLDTIVVDPTGRVVDETYPGATTDESQIPSTIVVKDPIPGEWSVQVLGVETSYEQEPFYTIVAFKDSKTTMVNSEMDTLQQTAAWCLPFGILLTLSSTLLLIGLGSKKKEH